MVLDAGARDGLHYPGEADQFVAHKALSARSYVGCRSASRSLTVAFTSRLTHRIAVGHLGEFKEVLSPRGLASPDQARRCALTIQSEAHSPPVSFNQLAVAFGHAAVAATDIHNYLCESDGERPPRGQSAGITAGRCSLVFPSAPIQKTTGRLFRRGHCWPPGATGSEARRRHDRRETSFSQRILLGGRADLAAGDFGEQHPQGQARSFMAAPTKIFSRISIDRDAKYQSITRSLDSEMAGGAGSELNQGLTHEVRVTCSETSQRNLSGVASLLSMRFTTP